ncbi:MAG TPA: HAD-IC family P-type ATPase [Myxococcota bacterium]|nr:HAD-IC family P-type ATPase [Myxococcota bacterium]
MRSAIGGGGRTPLQQALARLVSVLVGVALLFCVGLALVRLHQGYGAVDALVSAATLAVAALPEAFPVVFGFFLGVGVYRLAKRQALVRRAVSVENVGRVSCICSDKTGTVTEGRLRLAHLEPAGGASEGDLLALAVIPKDVVHT